MVILLSPFLALCYLFQSYLSLIPPYLCYTQCNDGGGLTFLLNILCIMQFFSSNVNGAYCMPFGTGQGSFRAKPACSVQEEGHFPVIRYWAPHLEGSLFEERLWCLRIKEALRWDDNHVLVCLCLYCCLCVNILIHTNINQKMGSISEIWF